MSYFERAFVQAADSASIDAFSRWRVSSPTTLLESNFRYDLAPLQYEQITSGGTIGHDATDAHAELSTTAGGAGQLAALQSYRWVRYQPGKSQLALITFIMGTAQANVRRRVGLFSATNSGATVTVQNGIYIEQTETDVKVCINNVGTQADEAISQADWNIDTMGAGVKNPSGKTLDLSKGQILVIDLQWLGLGRVRVGFDIDGAIYYVHQFLHANLVDDVYMQTATLPVRYELTTLASVASIMKPICAAVISEGGQDDASGYSFATEFSGTAGNGSRVHLGSIRPFLTFNSVSVRYPIIPTEIQTLVTGNSPVLFELVVGATFSAGPTWPGAAHSAYSGAEITSAAGTIATSPIVAASWYNAASATLNGQSFRSVSDLYPLTLDAAGAVRALGTMSIYATGIGGSSACRAAIQWKELR